MSFYLWLVTDYGNERRWWCGNMLGTSAVSQPSAPQWQQSSSSVRRRGKLRQRGLEPLYAGSIFSIKQWQWHKYLVRPSYLNICCLLGWDQDRAETGHSIKHCGGRLKIYRLGESIILPRLHSAGFYPGHTFTQLCCIITRQWTLDSFLKRI